MDFFEILQQGADDANDKNPQPEAPVNERAASKEAKQRAKVEAREAKLRAKEEQRQARDAERQARADEREQRRLEREAEDEHVADHEPEQAAEVHDDPRDALAALLAGGVVADAVDPQIAAAAPAAAAATPPASVPPVPADIPNEPVDVAQKYEWTAPLPAAAATGAAVTGAALAGASAGQDDMPPSSPNKPKKQGSGDGGKQKLIAWLVVAVIALVAIVVALILVIPALDGSQNNKPTPSPTKTTSTPTPSPTQTTESPTPTPSPTKTSDAPDIDPGATSPMDVPFWGVTFAVSTKFGSTQYNITGNTLLIDNAVIQSFPESCAALRTGWGITKAAPPAKNGVVVGSNAYNIAKPAGTCAADMDLYNKVWGLTQAMVDSAKALP